MHGSPLTRIRRFQREIFGECPECLLIMDEILKTYRADVLGVEIGASVAHAETVTDVSTWENATKSYGSNQTVKVMNGDKVLAAFTTNANVTLSYTPSSGDGTNGSITVDTWDQNCFRDATIYANTNLIWHGYNGVLPPTFTVTLSGGGASIRGAVYDVKLAADSTADAKIDLAYKCFRNSEGFTIACPTITGTDGTKLSEVGGYMLCGTVDVSEVSSIDGFAWVQAHVDANATVKTAQVTIHGPSTYDPNSAFYISDNTTTISGGTFGDIEATGTGKVIFGSTKTGKEYTSGNVTAGNVAADEVVGFNVKAKSIKANTVIPCHERSGYAPHVHKHGRDEDQFRRRDAGRQRPCGQAPFPQQRR